GADNQERGGARPIRSAEQGRVGGEAEPQRQGAGPDPAEPRRDDRGQKEREEGQPDPERLQRKPQEGRDDDAQQGDPVGQERTQPHENPYVRWAWRSSKPGRRPYV